MEKKLFAKFAREITENRRIIQRIRIGDIVLLKDDNSGRTSWKLAKVVIKMQM